MFSGFKFFVGTLSASRVYQIEQQNVKQFMDHRRLKACGRDGFRAEIAQPKEL